MSLLDTLFHYWPYFGSIFVLILGVTAFTLTDSEDRSVRRLKRRIRKFGLLGVGAVVAFAGSISVGMIVGTISSHDPTDPNSSPIYLVMGFMVVLLSAVFVGLLVTACVRLGKSRAVITAVR
jgi:drug/metabolite transporter (DMT)-like permease